MATASPSLTVVPPASEPPWPAHERWSGWLLLVWQVGRLVRARGTVWKRGLWVGLTFLFVLIWLAEASGRNAGIGRQGFRTLVTIHAWFIVGMVSSFSMAISREREEGSLDLLRISGLSSVGLLIALGTSEFVRLLFGLLVQVPLIFLCFTLGGLSFREVVSTYCLLIATAFFVCHVGMLMSVVSRTSRHASHHTIGLCLFLYLLPAQLLKSANVFSLGIPPWIISAVNAWNQINPWQAFQQISVAGPFPVVSVLFHVGAGLLLLPVTAVWLERNCEKREAAGTSRAKAQQRGNGKRRPRAGALAIAWKEYHFAAGGLRWVYFRWGIYLLTALGLTMLVSKATTRPDPVLTWQPSVLVVVGLLGLLVEVPLALTRMLGAEVVHRTLGDLAMLPLSFGRLMGEKLLGYLRCILIPALLFCAGWATLSPTSFFLNAWEDLPWYFALYGLSQCLLLMTLTVSFSLNKPSKAFSQAIGLLAMVHLCSWLALAVSGVRLEFDAVLMSALTVVTAVLIVWQTLRIKQKLEEVAPR